MNQGSILVTGGAGYIGSHVVKQLHDLHPDIPVIVLDNLSTGFKDSVINAEFVQGNMNDVEAVAKLINAHKIETCIHFAAHTIVPESVANPLKYYDNNTAGTKNLLKACSENGVKNFIFSSTAAVYGIPENKDGQCSEQTPTSPINPYGWSKLMSEQMIRDTAYAQQLKVDNQVAGACALNYVILRYFNVAGGDPQGRIGQSTKAATLLTKVAVETALGKRDHLKIFGTDYNTPDGTGVRDYIHVEDLASAHLDALQYLQDGGESTTLNAGYGHGYSVKEVINMVEEVCGKPLPVIEEARRAGDPPTLIAQSNAIKEKLGWAPKYDDLKSIVSTAYAWEQQLSS